MSAFDFTKPLSLNYLFLSSTVLEHAQGMRFRLRIEGPYQDCSPSSSSLTIPSS